MVCHASHIFTHHKVVSCNRCHVVPCKKGKITSPFAKSFGNGRRIPRTIALAYGAYGSHTLRQHPRLQAANCPGNQSQTLDCCRCHVVSVPPNPLLQMSITRYKRTMAKAQTDESMHGNTLEHLLGRYLADI